MAGPALASGFAARSEAPGSALEDGLRSRSPAVDAVHRSNDKKRKAPIVAGHATTVLPAAPAAVADDAFGVKQVHKKAAVEPEQREDLELARLGLERERLKLERDKLALERDKLELQREEFHIIVEHAGVLSSAKLSGVASVMAACRGSLVSSLYGRPRCSRRHRPPP